MSQASIKCAFCNGKGLDPFGIPSSLSSCQTCLGRGTVKVHGKTVPCPYCTGDGKDPHHRLTCPVCWGKGAVTVAEETETCPECKGSGRIHGSTLPCLTCGGKGVIKVKNSPLERKKKKGELVKDIERLQQLVSNKEQALAKIRDSEVEK